MHKQKVKHFLLLCFLSCTHMMQAQTLFTGNVKTENGKPVVSASIKLKDSTRGVIRLFALTDPGGNFMIRLPSTTRHYLAECSFIGYKTDNYVFDIQVGNSGPVTHNIVLMQDTALLQEIHVYAAPPIKVSGDTTTFRTDAFKQGNESNVGDLLNNIPGFSVENGRIKYNGRSVSKVLLEGDDLFGQDYNTITQNLGPRGIEKIELIDNYNDRSYLSSRLQKGKELVVNLRFDKKFLYKIIASAEAAIDPGLNYYKTRQNIVSLIPKIKFVTTTNFNNTGLLGTELLGNIAGLPDYKKDGVNFDLPQSSSIVPLAQMRDIASAVIPKDKLVFNHTQFVSNNMLYKPSHKLLVRNTIQYYRDTYHQQQSRNEDYTVPGANFSVLNTQYQQKRMPYLNIANEIIYTVNPKLQLVYKLNYYTNRETDSSAEVRQVTYPINTRLAVATNGLRQQLGLSVMIDSIRILDIRAFHFIGNSHQQSSLFPADLYRPLTGDTVFRNLKTVIDDEHCDYMLQAKLSVKKRRGFYFVEALYTSSSSKLFSDLFLYDKGPSLHVNNSALINQSVLQIVTGSVNADITQNLTQNTVFHLTQKIETGNISLLNVASMEHRKKYFNYLPSAELRIRLDKRQNLSLRWGVEIKLPDTYDLYSSNIIVPGSNAIRGIDELYTGTSKRTTLTYNYSDPVKRKLTAFAIVSYAQEPVMYLMNSVPGIFYTLQNKIAFPGNGRSLIALGNLSKYISALKTQVTMDLNAISHNTYYAVNNQSGPFALSTLSGSVKCKTLITDRLITTIGLQAAFVSQELNKGEPMSRSAKNRTLNYSTALTYRFSTDLVFTGRFQHISQTASTLHHQLNLCDLSLKYVILREKLGIDLSANNLLSPNIFTTTMYTPLSTVTQSVNMLPPYLMLKISYDL
ncbi:MAG: hypothetical protein V4539_07145 [Bacteroidota bacterium]